MIVTDRFYYTTISITICYQNHLDTTFELLEIPIADKQQYFQNVLEMSG